MKKLFTLLLLVVGTAIQAQSFNFECIDVVHYTFKMDRAANNSRIINIGIYVGEQMLTATEIDEFFASTSLTVYNANGTLFNQALATGSSEYNWRISDSGDLDRVYSHEEGFGFDLRLKSGGVIYMNKTLRELELAASVTSNLNLKSVPNLQSNFVRLGLYSGSGILTDRQLDFLSDEYRVRIDYTDSATGIMVNRVLELQESTNGSYQWFTSHGYRWGDASGAVRFTLTFGNTPVRSRIYEQGVALVFRPTSADNAITAYAAEDISSNNWNQVSYGRTTGGSDVRTWSWRVKRLGRGATDFLTWQTISRTGGGHYGLANRAELSNTTHGFGLNEVQIRATYPDGSTDVTTVFVHKPMTDLWAPNQGNTPNELYISTASDRRAYFPVGKTFRVNGCSGQGGRCVREESNSSIVRVKEVRNTSEGNMQVFFDVVRGQDNAGYWNLGSAGVDRIILFDFTYAADVDERRLGSLSGPGSVSWTGAIRYRYGYGTPPDGSYYIRAKGVLTPVVIRGNGTSMRNASEQTIYFSDSDGWVEFYPR